MKGGLCPKKVKNMATLTFKNNGMVLSFVDGRTDFTTCSDALKSHVNEIVIGTAKLSNERAFYAERLKSAENKLEKMMSAATVDFDEIEDKKLIIEGLKSQRDNKIKEIKRYMPNTTDADKRLYLAYSEAQTVNFDDASEINYQRAMLEWFDSFGMKMGKKDYGWLKAQIGKKKASNSTFRKSKGETLVTVMNERQFIELWYLIIADLLIKKNIIAKPEIKFTATEIDKLNLAPAQM